jgi:2-C-methyl-D-erythritol 2,4-cyclodiphosphate synthase
MNSSLRVGNGVDAHRFGDEGICALAGLQWPSSKKLVGHSDGDVAVHAICDALLSAAKLGDVGKVFGVDRPEMKDATGASMLIHVRKLLDENSVKIVNAAVAIVGNEPRISARRDEAEKVLSELLGAPVSVAATTTDGMGFTGRGEGVYATSHALVEVGAGK